MTKRKRVFTKKAMVWTSVRLSTEEQKLWHGAAEKLGISLTQFFRNSIRREANKSTDGGRITHDVIMMSHLDKVGPPKALSVAIENIPVALRALNQWVTWRYEITKDGKWTKIPYTDKNTPASSTNPKTWTSIFRAEDAYRTGRFDGIGFVVSVDDDFIGIDLDHCFNKESRQGERWAIDILQALASYSEFSPSGEGVRIFVKGRLPDGVAGKKGQHRNVFGRPLSHRHWASFKEFSSDYRNTPGSHQSAI